MSDNDPKTDIGDAPVSTARSQSPFTRQAADTRDWNDAKIVGRTITVNKPRMELYAYWRDFQNFPHFMENIKSVSKLDEKRSHWVVAAPAGRTVEWDAILTEDRAGEVLAWESAQGADIRNSGRIEFRDAPAGRGTEITATLVYDPPAGELGAIIAKLFRKEPKIQARQDLRRFKQLMETGEIPVSQSHSQAAAPHAE